MTVIPINLITLEAFASRRGLKSRPTISHTQRIYAYHFNINKGGIEHPTTDFKPKS